MVVLGVETIALVDEAMDQLRQVMDDNVPIVLYDSFFRIVMLTYLFQKRVSGYLTFYNDFEDFFEIAKAVLDGNRAFSMLPGEVKILDDWGGPRQVGLGTTHLFQLSGRELELFRLLLTGADPYDCSNMMGITVKSVENLKERLMRKLNVHSTSQLLLLGVKFGFGPR